ncbi:TIGR00153 family protein [Teredinibacter waterburyi]|jgi:conserved hypothetical protein TIGR00153|uniref:TIGR00153 family protein n=1 Tax=Teredinibacter waterburyi TaxID=1500538 RepID=UPI00165FF872|nr:TIGR00153 family protein [Teredinibacter waterburyi]
MILKNPLTEMFARSPIKPMEEHITVATAAASELNNFYKATINEDWDAALASYNKISDFEREGDRLKKNIRLRLPKSLFLPVPRSDLLELLTMQDKIANRCKDISGLMLGRKMVIPASLQTAVGTYIDAGVATVLQARKAIHELDELLETGFSGRELDLVEEMVETLNDLEQTSDQQQIVIRSGLYELEAALPPIDVMFLYRIIEEIGDLADRAQKVGSRLLLLLAR